MRRFEGDKLVIASHNAGKLLEMAALLAPFGISVSSASDHGLAEPEETEDNFIGNARIKAHFAAIETGLPALSDDSGITVDALQGSPGVYTADWAETPNGRDFPLAMTKVWHFWSYKKPRHRAKPRLTARFASRGPMGMMKYLKGALMGKWFGLCAVKRALGLTRYSNRMARPKHLARWIQPRNTP